MSDRFHDIAISVHGEEVRESVDARTTLVDFLRETVGLTGSHVGCEHGVCGACTVRVDGAVVRGCLMLAVQCDGGRVDTIEGVADTGEIADLQQAFVARNALQCGFCTPGMLLSAQELLAAGGVPSREAIRAHLSGNYCRCTGYQAIVDAVEAVAKARAGAAPCLREALNEDHRRLPSNPVRARPAQLLYRPLGAAAEPRASDAGPRPIRQRHDAAAHGACRLRPLAPCPCAHHRDRDGG